MLWVLLVVWVLIWCLGMLLCWWCGWLGRLLMMVIFGMCWCDMWKICVCGWLMWWLCLIVWLCGCLLGIEWNVFVDGKFRLLIVVMYVEGNDWLSVCLYGLSGEGCWLWECLLKIGCGNCKRSWLWDLICEFVYLCYLVLCLCYVCCWYVFGVFLV